ncbi:hypothetical protein M878_01685 [Streptomyces roseochromogenus subsp. oscitans DS 12.976]|uniref:Integral membrane protein n=2 Tax=Streptomyces roseochromogenus TaxID=285450 RepID=V6KWU0_STRRC|nr:hypothetical protein [Streptomyces roseochromogenus]EST36625.1 hypothetical protein M878_01685 [Streptomyces roseochromogenus subsp. oscitans DS 12.976]
MFRSDGTARHPPDQPQTDYAGAIYGSLLAASVIAGAAGVYASFPRLGLVVLLLATGIVFWAAHVYVHLAGERVRGQPMTWAQVRRVAGHEWPMVQAAVPPAVAVAISPLLDLGLPETAWFALGVALAEQVAWATVAAARAGASRRVMALSGLLNLLLGLVIVAAKTAVHH